MISLFRRIDTSLHAYRLILFFACMVWSSIAFGTGRICAYKADGKPATQADADRQEALDVSYRDRHGRTVIPFGQYQWGIGVYGNTVCIRRNDWLQHPQRGLERVNSEGYVLYEPFWFDNGPDYPSEGLFRMQIGELIGYADAKTGRILIKPQFQAAYPFENGRAQVSYRARTVSDGEHRSWVDTDMFQIDRLGRTVK